jgi:hypothetical protein
MEMKNWKRIKRKINGELKRKIGSEMKRNETKQSVPLFRSSKRHVNKTDPNSVRSEKKFKAKLAHRPPQVVAEKPIGVVLLPPNYFFLLLKQYSPGLPVGLLRLLGLGDPGEWGVPEAGVQLVHRGQQLRVDLPTV